VRLKRNLPHWLLLLVMLSANLLAQPAPAQSMATDTTEVLENVPATLTLERINVDSLFTAARTTAFEAKDYQHAISDCERILAQDSTNYDTRIFLGRLCAWSGQYTRAIETLSAVVAEQQYFDDARNALVDVFIWDKQYEQALTVIHAGLVLNPLNTELYYRQAVCHEALAEPRQARIDLHNLLRIEPGHERGQQLLKRLSAGQQLRKLTLAYSYDRLADTRTQWQALVGATTMDPWHLVTLELEQIYAFGPLIGRYSLANRFQETGMQFELEAYPHIRQGTYAYVGLGYSWTELFPLARGGLEVFQALPQGFEVSLGARLLHLESENVDFFTGSVGKYWGNYWFDLRSFVTPDSAAASVAWILLGRRYFEDAETYLELSLNQGESPDINPGAAELNYLSSRRLAVVYQRKLGKLQLVKAELSLANLEVRQGAYRGDTGFRLSYSRRF